MCIPGQYRCASRFQPQDVVKLERSSAGALGDLWGEQPLKLSETHALAWVQTWTILAVIITERKGDERTGAYPEIQGWGERF
jgi:hypothetical protein